MASSYSSARPPALHLVFYALFFLLFFQLITGLVEATYTFGLLETDIPPEVASILFLLTPLALLVFPRVLEGRTGRTFTLVCGLLVLVCRALTLLLDTRGKMLFGGLGTGLFLLFLPALLRQERGRYNVLSLGGGLAFSGLLAILLRAVNYGNDLGAASDLRYTTWGLILLAGMGLSEWLRTTPLDDEPAQPVETGGFWRLAGLWLGAVGALMLLYFGFTSPTVIARWTGEPYLWVTLFTAAPLALFAGLWLGLPAFRALLSTRVLVGWNLLFVLLLALTLRAHSIDFPRAPEAYPFPEPAPGPLAGIALVGMLLLHPVIYADFALLAGALASTRTAPRRWTGGLVVAAFYLVVMIFAHVFTTVYDYIPVAGPWFRDRFWLVYTAAGLALLPGVLLARGCCPPAPAAPARGRPFLTAGLMVAAAVLAVWAFEPRPAPADGTASLRVLTYNIQQGYSADGQKNFAGQLALIREARPDIAGLQESDTARIAGGNSDVVRYLASELDMYAYYGPKTTAGTFGIALLSRYPIHNPRTFYMYSAGEQTAAIEAEIRAGNRTFHVLVTHLGNGGPLIQQQQVLERLAGKENVIAMGDFNFDTTTEQYRLTLETLADAQAGTSAPPGRIDHVFVSPGIVTLSSQYLPEGPSDHPAVLVELGW